MKHYSLGNCAALNLNSQKCKHMLVFFSASGHSAPAYEEVDEKYNTQKPGDIYQKLTKQDAHRESGTNNTHTQGIDNPTYQTQTEKAI